MSPRRFALAVVLASAVLVPTRGTADPFEARTTTTAFDDVKFELENAIVARGLTIHSNGNIAKMLERTGADVGSMKPVYIKAEFVEVCSSKLARRMFEADPALMGNCPFLLYAYERADRPGRVVVGFRRLAPGTTPEARSAVQDVEVMLDEIVRDAVK
jgi:uncharacterized protein (DUF302 family)